MTNAETPSSRKTPPMMISSNSLRLMMATNASTPPRANEPVSPMMSRARRLPLPWLRGFHDDGQLKGR